MTNHPREVAQKLTEVLREILPEKHMAHIYHEHVAAAILQCPELQVTLRQSGRTIAYIMAFILGLAIGLTIRMLIP